MTHQKAKVLFVDDERAALEGFNLTQRKGYEIRLAESGEKGLEILRREPDVAVVVSDMRMPAMDGAAFLAKVRDEAPDVVRVLLTGHSDMEAAARAVNEGRIFRFLLKPCSPDDLAAGLSAAVKMYELTTAERVLLQKTLVGSVKAVVSVLGLTNPEALGRAVRIKDRTRLAAEQLGLDSRWGAEFAAMFSQISAATLPEDTARKMYSGRALSSLEAAQFMEASEAVTALLEEIPRLEPVTRILRELAELTRRPYDSDKLEVRADQESRLLYAVIELDTLESSGQTPRQAVAALRRRESVYGQDALDALTRVIEDAPEIDVAAYRPTDLRVGMVLAEDLKTTDGLLLLPRGFELTRSSCDHIVERFRHCLPERVRVHLVPGAGGQGLGAKERAPGDAR